MISLRIVLKGIVSYFEGKKDFWKKKIMLSVRDLVFCKYSQFTFQMVTLEKYLKLFCLKVHIYFAIKKQTKTKTYENGEFPTSREKTHQPIRYQSSLTYQ